MYTKKPKQQYVNDLIEEHAGLIIKIDKLEDYITAPENDDSKVEYANKAIQLAAMRKYAECLEVRLHNAGIYFEDGDYITKVASIIEDGPFETPEDKQDNKEPNDKK